MRAFSSEPCEKCEEMLQPYLDRELSDAERREAEQHLSGCDYCRRRYHFEEELRRYVRQATTVQMDAGLKARLASLRTPLL